MTAFLLSESDRDYMRMLVRAEINRQRRIGKNNTDDNPNDHMAPEVYVAMTPAGGIPAMEVTGTAGNLPGVADCQVFQSIDDEDGLYLQDIEDYDLPVYNLALFDMPGNTLILVARDKGGTWYAVQGGSTNSVEIVAVDNRIGISFAANGRRVAYSIDHEPNPPFEDIDTLVEAGAETIYVIQRSQLGVPESVYAIGGGGQLFFGLFIGIGDPYFQDEDRPVYITIPPTLQSGISQQVVTDITGITVTCNGVTLPATITFTKKNVLVINNFINPDTGT